MEEIAQGEGCAASGTYLKIYDAEGGTVICTYFDEQRIDAGVTAYLDSGGTRDRLLEVTLLSGNTYKVRASSIMSWYVSTPESRKAHIAFDRVSRDEETAMRHELGIWDED